MHLANSPEYDWLIFFLSVRIMKSCNTYSQKSDLIFWRSQFLFSNASHPSLSCGVTPFFGMLLIAWIFDQLWMVYTPRWNLFPLFHRKLIILYFQLNIIIFCYGCFSSVSFIRYLLCNVLTNTFFSEIFDKYFLLCENVKNSFWSFFCVCFDL